MKVLSAGLKMRYLNSPICVYDFKNFPGVIPGHPLKRGRKGREREMGKERRLNEGKRNKGKGNKGGKGSDGG
jgi:hypothetical protein